MAVLDVKLQVDFIGSGAWNVVYRTGNANRAMSGEFDCIPNQIH